MACLKLVPAPQLEAFVFKINVTAVSYAVAMAAPTRMSAFVCYPRSRIRPDETSAAGRLT